VLTIIAQPSEDPQLEPALRERRKSRVGAAKVGLLATNDLSAPGVIVEQLTSEDCPPVVSILLPGWIWNLERRKQWRLALEAWRVIDHVVILVELPPAFEAESVLLAENIPNLIWLVDCDKSDSEETLVELETLRHAGCNLVGAVFNREQTAPMRAQFSRWIGSARSCCSWPDSASLHKGLRGARIHETRRPRSRTAPGSAADWQGTSPWGRVTC
jgi:hypothetical protein